jgi:hypothetical protein
METISMSFKKSGINIVPNETSLIYSRLKHRDDLKNYFKSFEEEELENDYDLLWIVGDEDIDNYYEINIYKMISQAVLL